MNFDRLNRAEFSAITGMSPSTINRRVDQGMPATKAPDGQWVICCSDAVNWLVERANAKAGRMTDLERAEVREREARAGLVELKLAEVLKTVVDVDSAAKVVTDTFAMVRRPHEELPDEIAEALAAESDPASCRRIMRDAVNRALARNHDEMMAGANQSNPT